MTPATSKATSTNQQDAIAILKEDHQTVDKLFKGFEKLTKAQSDEGKAEIVQQICTELTIHAHIEETIFYPAVREAIDDEDLLDEAEVEHAGIKDLIAQLESMQPGEDLYDARVTVLGEYVRHHVEEEETEMFPKAKKAKIDLAGLGEELANAKQEWMAKGKTNAPKSPAQTKKVQRGR